MCIEMNQPPKIELQLTKRDEINSSYRSYIKFLLFSSYNYIAPLELERVFVPAKGYGLMSLSTLNT